jgi:hypothetical protein
MPKPRKPRLWRLLTALSLALTLTSCATPTNSARIACPNSVWPDKVTADWLVNTPHPIEVTHWKDRYVRQQCLIDGGKDCDR